MVTDAGFVSGQEMCGISLQFLHYALAFIPSAEIRPVSSFLFETEFGVDQREKPAGSDRCVCW